MHAGTPERRSHDYERHGTVDLFAGRRFSSEISPPAPAASWSRGRKAERDAENTARLDADRAAHGRCVTIELDDGIYAVLIYQKRAVRTATTWSRRPKKRAEKNLTGDSDARVQVGIAVIVDRCGPVAVKLPGFQSGMG